jgi:hypothetical protein
MTSDPELAAVQPEDQEERIWARLGNPIRTSAGDPPPDLTVYLPAPEVRELEQRGLAVRVPKPAGQPVPDEEAS